jgi:hypothetical protein
MLKSVLARLRDQSIGVSVLRSVPGAEILEVDAAGITSRFAVLERRRAPHPGELEALESRHRVLAEHGWPLLVARFVPETVGRGLVEKGWSWADAAGSFELRAPGLLLSRRAVSKPSPSRVGSRHLPMGRASRSIIRWMGAHGGREVWATAELAEVAQCSLPAVSQLLGRLETLGLAARRERGAWTVASSQLLEIFLEQYPGPGGEAVHYYSLDPLVEIAAWLTDELEGHIVASADVGPDMLAPWRVPSALVLYAREPMLLPHRRGLVGAAAPPSANITLIVPEDMSVFPPMDQELRGTSLQGKAVALSEPVQMLWDLQRLGGSDRQEQAESLTRWMKTLNASL